MKLAWQLHPVRSFVLWQMERVSSYQSNPISRSHLVAVVWLAIGATLSVSLPVRAEIPRQSAPWLVLELTQAGSRQTEADRLLELGIQQYRTGQPTPAIATLQQALQLYQAIADQRKVARTLRNLGNAHYTMSGYEQALTYFQQSLDLARQIGDKEGESAALGNMGVVYANLGDYDKADQYYQQALTLNRANRDRLGEGQILGNLAEVFQARGEYAKAIDYLQQTIVIARELKDLRLEANSLGSLGIIYFSLSNFAKALQYHQQQLDLARRLQDKLGESAALSNLGNSYYALGHYGQAIAYQEQRLTLARQIQDRLGEAQSLANLATIYYDLADYIKAIEAAFQSLEIARAIQNPAAEAVILTRLGNLYYVLQDFPKAIEYHQKRLDLARAANDLGSVTAALNNLGVVYRALGNYPKAIDYHQQALTLARQMKDRLGESSALLNLGVEQDELGQAELAIAFYRQALILTRETQDRATEGLVLNNLGNTLFKTGQLREAETILRQGLQVWEVLRASLGDSDRSKISIFDQQARTYRLLQRVLVAQNQPEAALEIAERGRARAFVDLLSRRLSARTDQPITVAAPTLAQIKQIARQQQATLVEYSITYEDIKVQNRVQAREVELFIWAIAPTGAITFRRVDLRPLAQQGKSLEDWVVASREQMGVQGRGLITETSAAPATDRQSGNPLYQWLIQPIADVLPQDPNARVIFIPQRSLFLVPFAALRDETGTYLVDKHTILIAPSIQVLELTRKQRSAVRGQRSSALVVGNPTMPKVPLPDGQAPVQLDPLPGAEQEAQAIAPLLSTEAITGNRASKSAIVQQMPQARIIHLATHGLLDDLKGLGVPGAIALAPDPPTIAPQSGDLKQFNGLLTADEILNLKLSAELVVLSACDTGRGRITGDGVIGLSRSFISAGVPSLVVSLWAVPDAPTAFLMAEFYQNLKRNPDKAQALRQAMLTTKQQYPDPKDWAAFILIGEAE